MVATEEPTKVLHELTAQAPRTASSSKGSKCTVRASRTSTSSSRARRPNDAGPPRAPDAAAPFWRNREAAFFSFVFPILLLLLIGSVYGDNPIEGVSGPTYLLIGLLGYGVFANAFASLAITLVVRREAGLLKRVRGTLLGAGTHLVAVIGSTVVVIVLEVIAQLSPRRLRPRRRLARRPVVFSFAILLGAAAFAALGLAVTTVVRTAEGSSAVVNAIYLPMAFISGVFFSTAEMPAFLEAISEVLPLTYFLDLIRTSFLPGEGLGASSVAASLWASSA